MTRHFPQTAIRAARASVINTADGKSHEAREPWKIAVRRDAQTRAVHQLSTINSQARSVIAPRTRASPLQPLQHFRGRRSDLSV